MKPSNAFARRVVEVLLAQTATYVKSCYYFCYVKVALLIVKVGIMPWPETETTMNSKDYHTKVAQSKGWLSAIVVKHPLGYKSYRNTL